MPAPDAVTVLLSGLGSVRAHREPANKNLAFLAPDGLMTIGYTGLAHLHGVPMDRSLARKLADG